jgi:Sodium/hydrogen exchanger family
MPAISFNSVLIIAGIAVLVPVVLGLVPRLPVPGAVLEVIAGIVVGPSVLGWVRVDAPVQVLSDLGLGMLLFLAGLEIDIDRLREPLARLAGLAFAVSAGLGLLAALTFWLAGQATQPLLLATIFMSTSAGLLLPLLKDAGEGTTEFGQLVMTAAAIAEIVPIMLLSLFFSAALPVRFRVDPRRIRRRPAGEADRDFRACSGSAVQDQAGRHRIRLSHSHLLHHDWRFIPAEEPSRAPSRDRRGAAVRSCPAGRAGLARPALPAPHRHPPGSGRWPAAGHHAHVRDRGDADRVGHREDHADRGRLPLVAAGLLTAALFPAGAQHVLSRATPARSGHTAKDSGSARAGRSTVTPGEEGECSRS